MSRPLVMYLTLRWCPICERIVF